jgi:RHH-type transcriptional regulator, rel operon repressor / antitoxin RelB
MSESKTRVLSLRLDKAMLSDLEALAEQNQRSKAYLVEDAVSQYLHENVWQVAEIEKAVREADAGDFASAAEVQSLTDKYKNT